MKKVLQFVTLACLTAALAMAQSTQPPTRGDVPEIDASMAASAVAMLSGALVMLRRRR